MGKSDFVCLSEIKHWKRTNLHGNIYQFAELIWFILVT